MLYISSEGVNEIRGWFERVLKARLDLQEGQNRRAAHTHRCSACLTVQMSVPEGFHI